MSRTGEKDKRDREPKRITGSMEDYNGFYIQMKTGVHTINTTLESAQQHRTTST